MLKFKKHGAKYIYILSLTLALLSGACKEEELDAFLLPGGGVKPSVTATFPENGARQFSNSSALWVLFAVPMDQQKTQSAVRLSSQSGTVRGRFSWEGQKLVYTLAEPLTGGVEYTLTVSRSAESSDGVDLGEDYIVRFYAIEDREGPVFISSTPASGTVNVAPDASIEITFSEPIDYSTVDDGISITPSFVSTKTLNAAGNTLIINPSSDLTNSSYTINISGNIMDRSGNRLQKEMSLTFTVGEDFTEPSLNSVQAGAVVFTEAVTTSGVVRTESIVIQFSEPMDRTATEDAVIFGGGLTATPSWNAAGDQVTYSFNPLPTGETNYSLTISATAKDAAGNALDRSYIYYFYTNGIASLRPKVEEVLQAMTNFVDSGVSEGAELRINLAPSGFAPFSSPLFDYDKLSSGEIYDYDPVKLTCCYGLILRLKFNNAMNYYSFGDKVQFQGVYPPSAPLISVDYIEVVNPGTDTMVYVGLQGTPPAGSTYRLVVDGGDSGILDTNGNTMAEDHQLLVTF